MSLQQEPDSIGQSFTFFRDGKPVFIKGANWIPVHSFPVDNKANRDRYREDAKMAQQAREMMYAAKEGGAK